MHKSRGGRRGDKNFFFTVATNICEPPVWNLLHFTLLAPRILSRLPDFLENFCVFELFLHIIFSIYIISSISSPFLHLEWQATLQSCNDQSFGTHILNLKHTETFYKILCYVDRASRYIHLKKNQLDAQFIFGTFPQTPLHVSGVSIAHHQQVLRMDKKLVLIVLFRWLSLVLAGFQTQPGQQLLYPYSVPPDDGL